MLRIDKQEELPEVPGVTVWGDEAPNVFYALPAVPTWRRMDDGNPAFKFVKYKVPIESNRPDGQKGGAYVFFDTEIAIGQEKLTKLKQVLGDRLAQRWRDERRPGTPPPVQLGTMTFTRGTVGLLMEKDGKIVEAARGAGVPSLYGSNVATFAVELSQLGATVFEAAMQGQGASAVNVVYKLWFVTKLPPLSASVWFNADQFYSFFQEIDIEENLWSEDSYRETLRETMIDRQAIGSTVDFSFVLPDPEQDKKLKDSIRGWAQRAAEDMAAKKMAAAIDPVSAEGRKALEDSDNIEDVVRDIKVHKITSFTQSYTENAAVEWNVNPQGVLAAITSLKNKQGRPVLWKDVAIEVDPDDPFFREINVTMQVNAEFARLPIHSVEVHIEYPKGNGRKDVKEYVFSDPGKIERFRTYQENENWEYSYYYQVNYKGQSRTFKSPVQKSDEGHLMINVDDTGILSLDIIPGDINWDQVEAVQLVVRYEDQANGVAAIEQQYTLKKDTPTQALQKVIFQPQRNPYQYKARYRMVGGKEFETDWQTQRTTPLLVNDPFSALKKLTVRATGDLENDVQNIFVDLVYTGANGTYTQKKSITLNSDETFQEWEFPVLSEAGGQVTYSGSITYRDGRDETIPETPAKSDTILVGPRKVGELEVTINPDLMFDNADVRLCKVALKYDDPANQIRARKEATFRQGDSEPVTWKVSLKDNSRLEYQWQATFFLTGSDKRKTEWEPTEDQSIFPQLPE